MNFTYRNVYLRFSTFTMFLHNCTCKDTSFCDDLLGQYSYVSESLGNMSLIDHIFMSNNLKNHPISFTLINSGCNLSDNKFLTFVLNVMRLKGPGVVREGSYYRPRQVETGGAGNSC